MVSHGFSEFESSVAVVMCRRRHSQQCSPTSAPSSAPSPSLGESDADVPFRAKYYAVTFNSSEHSRSSLPVAVRGCFDED